MISMGREDFIELYESLGSTVTGDEVTPKAIRVNPLKTGDQELVDILTDQGVELEKIPFLDHGYKLVSSPFSLGASIEYLLGYYSLQETASQLPVQMLSPSGEDRVLDMAAAPGGKTTQMAAYMGNQGSVTAIDINRRRPKEPFDFYFAAFAEQRTAVTVAPKVEGVFTYSAIVVNPIPCPSAAIQNPVEGCIAHKTEVNMIVERTPRKRPFR